MAKLERKKFKVFGENAPLDEIGQFGSAKATTKKNTKDIEEIQELDAWSDGWGGAVISNKNYPPMEEMTGAMNVMSYQTAYTLQEGIPEWNKDTTYYKGSIVKNLEGEDVKLYQSISNDNLNNPLSNTDNWSEISFGGSGLEVGDIGMALYVDETKGLRRYLNGQIVDINANTQAFLDRLKKIQTTNPDYFTTEDSWQAEALLNIDGCVYKFVLNYADDGETVVSVRLPKYPDYVEINAGGTLPVVGNGITLGLTNGTNNYGISTFATGYGWAFSASTGAYGIPVRDSNITGSYIGCFGVTSDPTKSGIQTTLKQTKLKLRYFIQIATGSETEANIVNTLENVNGFTLLESKYSDKPLYNESWLLSNGQWNSKAVYPTAYEGLQVEYNTEIEAGTTVTLPSGVSYTKRGLSVKLSTETYTDYDFVLNTAEETFRLPLDTIDHPINSTGTLPVVGNGMTLGLTNGSDYVGLAQSGGSTNRADMYLGAYGKDVGSSNLGTSGPAGSYGITTNPTKSGIVADLTATKANLYLYFYVGETVQNANLIDAGRIGEQLANKQDKCIHITETYQNGSSWYRVYSDGWCEQGGYSTISTTITLLKVYNNTNYTITIGTSMAGSGSGLPNCLYSEKTVSSFYFRKDYVYEDRNAGGCWQTCGYIR